jgi:hypothetical protein
MLWSRAAGSGGVPDKGAEFRRVHEEWLNRALVYERQSGREYPRIPLRRVDAGGFGPLLERPHGVERARRWWELVLERLDPVEP